MYLDLTNIIAKGANVGNLNYINDNEPSINREIQFYIRWFGIQKKMLQVSELLITNGVLNERNSIRL